MKIHSSLGLDRVVFELAFDAEDHRLNRRARPGQRTCSVWLPHRLRSLHPDLVCLAGLLIAFPWIKRKVSFSGDFRPSPAFADAVSCAFSFRMEGAEQATSPRPMNPEGRPGLAFSAGVDSVAALELMPDDTVGVYLNRVGPDRFAPNSNYRTDFARHAVGELRRQGLDIITIDSDLEFTRQPAGVPVDWANAVPAILLADEYNLSSIAWGLVLESAYCVGTSAFQNWAERPVAKKWGHVFHSVGLPMSPVVAGLSEVCTSSIVSRSRFSGLAQSCVRGTIDTPCGSCPKCFRKGLLDAALGNRPFSSIDFRHYLGLREVQQVLLETPIKHENVVGYSMSKYDGSDELARALVERLRALEPSADIFDRYYAPYLDSLPEFERPGIESKLNTYAEPMSAEDERVLESWQYEGIEDGLKDMLSACMEGLRR